MIYIMPESINKLGHTLQLQSWYGAMQYGMITEKLLGAQR